MFLTPLPDLTSGRSWEIGTVTEALLEYSWPQLSVFNNAGSIPPPTQLYAGDYPIDVINISTTWVSSTALTGFSV